MLFRSPDFIEYSFPPVEELPPPPPEFFIKISISDQLIQNARNAVIPLPIANFNLKSNSDELIKNTEENQISNIPFPIPPPLSVDINLSTSSEINKN